MKLKIILSGILFLLFITSCSKSNNPIQVEEKDDRIVTKIFPYEYSEQHFFVDELYADSSPELNLFDRFYGHPFSQGFLKYEIKEIEVWISAQGYLHPEDERLCNLFIDIPERGLGLYPLNSPLRDISQAGNPATSEIAGRFVKIDSGVDYILNRLTGLLSIRKPIGMQQSIGIAMQIENNPGNEDDIFYGEFSHEFPYGRDTLALLKLVKPRSLSHTFHAAWRNQLKNIYFLEAENIIKENFELNIYYKNSDSVFVDNVNGIPLLQLFGFDQANENGEYKPDGKFDFVRNKTIIPELGMIIFPSLQPFGSNLPKVFSEDYRNDPIYTFPKEYAVESLRSKKFLIEAKFYTED